VTLFPATGTSVDLGTDGVFERIGSRSVETSAEGDTLRGRGRYIDGSTYDMGALYALWSQSLARAWTLLVGARATLVHAEAPLDPLFEPDLQERLDRTLFGAVGSVGVRFDVSPSLAWVLSALSGFRAPNLEDFQAFGGGARGFTVPNPNLSEEHSWTVESGVKLDQPDLQASVFVFGSVLTGLIVRVPSTWDGMSEIDGEPVLRRDNASRTLMLGAEGQVTARLPLDTYASAAATAVWGETRRSAETGGDVTEPATKIPGPVFALRAGYDRRTGPFFAELAAVFQLPQSRLSEGDRLDVRLCADPENCAQVEGYVNVALRAGLRLDEMLALTLVADNLLDVAYKSYASGAYAPGRNLMVGLRGSL
jgi:hemoglobin/transferrin/lactoferrin receptor protein